MILHAYSTWNCPPSHYFTLRERRAQRGGICSRYRWSAMRTSERSMSEAVRACENSHAGLSEWELQVGGAAGRSGKAKLHLEGVAGSSRGSDCERQHRGGGDARGGLQWQIQEKACSHVSVSFLPHVLGSRRCWGSCNLCWIKLGAENGLTGQLIQFV